MSVKFDPPRCLSDEEERRNAEDAAAARSSTEIYRPPKGAQTGCMATLFIRNISRPIPLFLDASPPHSPLVHPYARTAPSPRMRHTCSTIG